MDVDFSPVSIPTYSDPVPTSSPVVCLPYSLIPGIDIASQSYQKAVITLGKQKTNAIPVTESVPLISVLDRGISDVTICSLIPLTILTDVILGASQGLDFESIEKARKIINNAVIQDLERDESSSSDIYTRVLRRHIISHCQHLRVSLFSVESLMTLHNEYLEKNTSGQSQN